MKASRLLVTSAVFALGVSGAPVSAQGVGDEAEAADDRGVIVVTAQFREQSVQDTPLAITAISSEMLEARSQTSVTDIAGQAPSVKLKSGGGVFGPSLQAYIRGIGQYDNNLGYEPGVGLYVDDVYFSTLSGSVLDLLDLERVEVLRGPQGTLAGKNSIGGAIKLVTKKPRGDGSGYASISYGSFDRVEARAAADFALTKNLFARISGVAHDSDGYVDRIDYECENPGSGIPSAAQTATGCKLGTEGGRSYVGGRLALRWLPVDAIEVNFSADYVKDDSEVFPNQLLALPNGTGAMAVPPPGSPYEGQTIDDRFVTAGQYKTYSTYCNPYAAAGAYCLPNDGGFSPWGVHLTLDAELADNLALKSITAYRGFDGAFTLDNDASPLVTSPGYNTLSQEQFTQELRLTGRMGEYLDFAVGGFYLDARNNNGGSVDIAYAAPGFGHLIDDDVVNKSMAAFAQLEFHLTDALHIIGGIRYTDDEKTYKYVRESLANDGTTAIPTGIGVDGESATYKADRVDYRLGANFNVTDDLMVYGQFSTGYKGGGTNPRPFNAGQLFSFGSETVNSYEAGLKSQFLDRRVRLNLAGFYSDYQDIQLVLLACPDAPCAGPQNVGSANIYGFEAELFAEPVDGFTIDASLSYLDFGYYEITPSPNFPGADAAVGLDDVNPFVSKWQWSIGVQYVVDLPDGATFTPRIDAAYQSKYYTDPNNGPNNLIDGYTLANARLTYKTADRGWEASLAVTNLFDKYYYSSYNDNVAFNGLVFGAPGRPREYLATLRKNF